MANSTVAWLTDRGTEEEALHLYTIGDVVEVFFGEQRGWVRCKITEVSKHDDDPWVRGLTEEVFRVSGWEGREGFVTSNPRHIRRGTKYRPKTLPWRYRTAALLLLFLAALGACWWWLER